ncbi:MULTISPECIES: DUF6515 family protein [Marinomonas]|jgi:hypothetical protein|uniref:DUF6515 family protein n=1 Tax=Marinomonas TaxID=28253 RepID=UPI001056E17E|nr:DUF6515 family protein [Marinomonas sp. KMM3893]
MRFRSVLALSCCLTLSGCAMGPRGGAPLGLFAFGAGVAIGSVLTTLPPRHVVVRNDIYYSDGVFYRDGPRGYVVIVPSPGVWVDDIPEDHKVVHYQEHDYFKCKGIWYRFDAHRKQYRVVEDPF